MPQVVTLNLSQIDQIVHNDNLENTHNNQTIKNNLINFSFNDTTISPLMPTLQFLDKTKKRSLLGKSKVEFQQGGKIITMQKNTIIVSQELFTQDNIEMRLRILSFISGCLHFGYVEQTAYELTKNIDNIGIWVCLDSQCSSDHSKLEKVQGFCLQIDSIVGLNLNFVDDIVSLRLFTRDGILILFQKKGSLMKYEYIQCLEGQTKFEVLN